MLSVVSHVHMVEGYAFGIPVYVRCTHMTMGYVCTYSVLWAET